MTARTSTPQASALTGAAVVGLAAVAAVLIVTKGQQLRDEAEKHALVHAAAEHGAVCDRLGIPAGTSKHSECLRELDLLKTLHERWAAEAHDGII
jgi:hypothetical protein